MIERGVSFDSLSKSTTEGSLVEALVSTCSSPTRETSNKE